MFLVVVSVAAVAALGEAEADDRVNGFHRMLDQDVVAQHDVEDDQLQNMRTQIKARLRPQQRQNLSNLVLTVYHRPTGLFMRSGESFC